MTTTNQLELGFNGQRTTNAVALQRQQKLHRAKWWFAQMRRAIDNAVDWQPTPVAPPEQTWFAEARAGRRAELRALPQHVTAE
ncbi:MAG: hypothetical protein RL380_1662 [Verrucomicrobiota bacterium]|jgi:hypothetical protein